LFATEFAGSLIAYPVPPSAMIKAITGTASA